MKKIVTHNAKFHADDVFALAALELYLGDEKLEVVRTRDEEVIYAADWVFDVGGVYNPDAQRFDHHQAGAPVRENGIPYAAFGLVWKHVGETVAGSKEVADKIEENLVLSIDADDNGINLTELTDHDVAPVVLPAIIAKLNPVWGSDEDYDTNYLQAVAFAKQLLIRFIAHVKAKIEMNQIVEETYQAADDKRIIVFDTPVSTKLFVSYPDVYAAVVPDDPKISTNWAVIAMRKDENSFESRFTFPKEWGGLRGEELVRVSGIPDAVFCHRNGFLLITKSKESALKAAEEFAK